MSIQLIKSSISQLMENKTAMILIKYKFNIFENSGFSFFFFVVFLDDGRL